MPLSLFYGVASPCAVCPSKHSSYAFFIQRVTDGWMPFPFCLCRMQRREVCFRRNRTPPNAETGSTWETEIASSMPWKPGPSSSMWRWQKETSFLMKLSCARCLSTLWTVLQASTSSRSNSSRCAKGSCTRSEVSYIAIWQRHPCPTLAKGLQGANHDCVILEVYVPGICILCMHTTLCTVCRVVLQPWYPQ